MSYIPPFSLRRATTGLPINPPFHPRIERLKQSEPLSLEIIWISDDIPDEPINRQIHPFHFHPTDLRKATC